MMDVRCMNSDYECRAGGTAGGDEAPGTSGRERAQSALGARDQRRAEADERAESAPRDGGEADRGEPEDVGGGQQVGGEGEGVRGPAQGCGGAREAGEAGQQGAGGGIGEQRQVRVV